MSWPQLFLVAFIVWVLFQIEKYLRKWYASRHKAPTFKFTQPTRIIGTVSNSAEAHSCAGCQKPTHDFANYDNGLILCPTCQERI